MTLALPVRNDYVANIIFPEIRSLVEKNYIINSKFKINTCMYAYIKPSRQLDDDAKGCLIGISKEMYTIPPKHRTPPVVRPIEN